MSEQATSESAPQSVAHDGDHHHITPPGLPDEVSALKRLAALAIDFEAVGFEMLQKEIAQHHMDAVLLHSALTRFLASKGFSLEQGFQLPTIFRAVHGSCQSGVSRPTVALMCVYAALESLGHDYQHNVITVAAVLGVKAAMLATSAFCGQLILLGTPAAEDSRRLQLVDGGAFNDINVAMTSYPEPAAAGDFLSRQVTVTYTGRTSPFLLGDSTGINSLDAAVLAYNNVSCMRQQMKPTWSVQALITNGTGTFGITPALSTMTCRVGADSAELQMFIDERVTPCYAAAATATHCQVEYAWDELTLREFRANPALKAAYDQNAKE